MADDLFVYHKSNSLDISYRNNSITADQLTTTLQWRHNERNGVSNHQPQHCLLNRLFRHISKKTLKLRVTGLFGEFPGDQGIPRTKGQ